MRIQLLGGFGIERGGVPVDGQAWRLRKARTLVKMLALAPDQRLHRDLLIEELWPDRPPASAVNNLHQALHVGRRVLAGDDPSDGLLELRDEFVVLRAGEPVEVDVRTFERLAVAARASGRLAELRAAVGAYTGDLLPEDRFADWATRPREELRASFCDLLVEFADVAGPDVEAYDALQRALAIDPLHERGVRSLMRRLAAMGRSSEALAQYERLRGELRTAYGTDPDPETQRVYRDLLTGDVEEPATAPRHNLAPALTSFVGREREIADVHRLLERGRLVTLTGVGGAGKTRLAEETARRLLDSYTDGIWIADLVPVADPRLVADTVAEALGLDPAAGSDSLRILIGRLARRNLLLVLDSCEHLLTACSELAGAVLRTCPGITILATSREPLHAQGEVTFRVPSLELPEAEDAADPARLETFASVRLFVERARDVRPGFVLSTDNAAAVVEICRCLDGIPLALELAAARASHLEPAEIAERLGDALPLLTRHGEITRHATLRAVLEWSHALLSDDEQVVLRRLAVFAGGFALRSAEAVCADKRIPATEVLDHLGRLVDKSLLQVDHDGPRSRYRLLETIRQFARERLVAAQELGHLEAAHCRYFLELALDQDPERAGIVERPQLLDVDHDNLRAALAWALRNDHERALLLGLSLSQYWLARGHFAEGADWLERILEVAVEPSRDRTRALFALAILDARRGLSDRMPGLGDRAVAVAEQSDEPADLVSARVLRGTLLLGSGDLNEIEQTASEALARADALGAEAVAATAQGLAGMVALFREDGEPAQRRLAECLRRLSLIDASVAPFFPAVTMCLPLAPVRESMLPVFEETFLLGRRVGAMRGTGYAWSAFADACRLAGDLGGALDAVRRSVDTFAAVEDAAGLGHALNHLGCIERDQGLFDPAGEHLHEALRIREQLGDRRGENLTLANLGLLSAAAGDPAEGRRLTRIAVDRGDAVDDRPGAAGALLDLVVVELFAGERRTARALAEQAVAAFRPQGYLRLEAWGRLIAAELAADDGDTQARTGHGQVAAELFGRLGCRIGTARTAALMAG
ncbi:BTAD domain-containing putative transcriptional regulator [Kribbella sp. NPDC004875]|uniref:BTAD domain-containing putative transcriptional regulator n=1 Tax=Kribbella sp. NPDC004875 TaxID=3364107 RepID=UPI0036D1D4DC